MVNGLVSKHLLSNDTIDNTICKLYSQGFTLRHIGEKIGKDHNFVTRRLIKNGVEIVRHKTKKPYSEKLRKAISMAKKGSTPWSKGKKMSRTTNIKNMMAHLKYNVTFEWVNGFEDLEKIKYLNHAISRKRDYTGFADDDYRAYIERFYNDDKFNSLYQKWIETGDKWIKPSLDHIHAKAAGGSLLVENLRFVSWFENRAKNDIPLEEWEKMKQHIQDYL